MEVGLQVPDATAGLLMVPLAPKPDSKRVVQAVRLTGWANLPEGLLVSVFNSLRHPRDLLACACVCKAWRSGESKAFQPVPQVLHSLFDHAGLDQLITLTPIQLAAVREVHMGFYGMDPQSATASVMTLAFVSRSLPRLQRLELEWNEPFEPDEDWSQVGCTADA